jgi:hypothetical protein
MVLALAACGNKEDKTYDISPIFPLSSNTCSKYDGDVEGTGITAHCWVSKSQCEHAVADWNSAMKNVPDSIKFTC